MNIKTQRTYLSINKRYLHRMESPGLFTSTISFLRMLMTAMLSWIDHYVSNWKWISIRIYIYLLGWGGGGYLVWKQQTNTLIMKLFFNTIHVQHLHLYLVCNQYLLDLESFYLRYLITGKITRVLTFRLIAFPSLLNSCNNLKMKSKME